MREGRDSLGIGWVSKKQLLFLVFPPVSGMVIVVAIFLIVNVVGLWGGTLMGVVVVIGLMVAWARLMMLRQERLQSTQLLPTIVDQRRDDPDLPPSYEDVTAKPPPYSILFLKVAPTGNDRDSFDEYVTVPAVPLTPIQPSHINSISE
ncbi:hypothetical protein Pcinc_023298 [Petrolisthes cinctipes]|uniref:Uncharacterized protein n=1 Tax=Petrolisthes cinctipes TaxID=88211 RepID=A0AAE1FCU4_PETCI|nr:hypothetical protein Pcinc_023298 [Petrolisthes cinctipes]